MMIRAMLCDGIISVWICHRQVFPDTSDGAFPGNFSRLPVESDYDGLSLSSVCICFF